MSEHSVERRSWDELTTGELYAVLKLRTDVFFVEQRIDEEELDGRDLEPATEHLFVTDAHGAAAYARILVDAEPAHRDARVVLGRVVTRADRRGEGLSRALLADAVARHGHEAMMLHAQEYIVPLYAAFGFERFGEVYTEAGLPHVSMYRPGS